MIHHDTFDYDVAAAPVLIDVIQQGRKIQAAGEITKSGLLFILDRFTGAPVFGVEERRVAKSDVPGEQSWPTQPFPLKPPALARNSITIDDISKLSPESQKFCTELLNQYPNSGPYTPFQSKGSTLFPSTMGGGNWGGVAFDAGLGSIFVNTSSFGNIGKMVKTGGTGTTSAGDEVMPYRNEAGYARFIDQDHYPCNQPPWGELTAVNANTGDIIWRVPLGSYPELERKGIKATGAPNIGGPIVTAGGLVFIAATNDGRFRAFDARTGAQLWQTDLVSPGEATPITYLGRDGKQYVVIATGSAGHLRIPGPTHGDIDTLTAFALPD
jgi:quinoprotein glucose dehydrogenase